MGLSDSSRTDEYKAQGLVRSASVQTGQFSDRETSASRLWQLPEVVSFSETFLQPGATGNVRKSINVIS
jgi:hypothetical protein